MKFSHLFTGLPKNINTGFILMCAPKTARESEVVIVVRRNAISAPQELLETLANYLKESGYSILFPNTYHLHKEIELEWSNLQRRIFATIPMPFPKARLIEKWLYILFKFFRLILFPKDMRQFFAEKKLKRVYREPDQLRRTLDNINFNKVHFLTQSAGGISAIELSSHDKVASICCLGYPFKHPENSEQDYRTKGLKNLTKPVLIVQGQEDEYGTVQDARKYEISDSVEFLEISGNHDCGNLSSAEISEICRRVGFFFDFGACQPMRTVNIHSDNLSPKHPL